MSEGTGENKADQGVTDTAGHSTGGEEKNDGPSSLSKGHPQQVWSLHLNLVGFW